MTLIMYAVFNNKNEMLHKYTRAVKGDAETAITKDGFSVAGLKKIGWRIAEVEIKEIEN